MKINSPQVVDEVLRVVNRYEEALVANDVDALIDLFWDSPLTIRFGLNESLMGAEQIEAFRRRRPAMDLARRVRRRQITTFGDDFATAAIEYTRIADGADGRQSQTWLRWNGQWKVVLAHISDLSS